MRKTFYVDIFLAFIGLFVSLAAYAAEAPPKSNVGSASKAFTNIIDVLPASDLKNGLKKYAEIVGLDAYPSDAKVGKSNQGMVSFFRKLYSDPKNSCVRDAANSFYDDVATYLKNKMPQTSDCHNSYRGEVGPLTSEAPDYGCSDNRAQILDTAAKGAFKKIEPGWLWKLALKHAKGDQNSAMLLVGICGHDDAFQGGYSVQANGPAEIEKINQNKVRVQQGIAAQELEIKKMKDNPQDSTSYHDELNRNSENLAWLKEMSAQISAAKTYERKMSCPPAESAFFAPQSLGAPVDIPEDLKKQLHVEFTEDGATKTPSKYYHVYGAAFMACQLVQEGVSPLLASEIQQQASRVYRGIRMCQAVEDSKNFTEFVQEFAKNSKEDFGTTDPEELAIQFAKDAPRAKEICNQKEAPAPCRFMNLLGMQILYRADQEFAMTDAQVRTKVRNFFKTNDASVLYEKWYLGGKEIKGQKIPCSDIRVMGPLNLRNPMGAFFGNLFKPDGWTDERYLAASKKLSTWDIDFKWTIALHKSGADFAGKVCKKNGAGEKSLKGICPGGPPDGKTVYEKKTTSPKSDNAPKSNIQ
jgi:hypothetical protein